MASLLGQLLYLAGGLITARATLAPRKDDLHRAFGGDEWVLTVGTIILWPPIAVQLLAAWWQDRWPPGS